MNVKQIFKAYVTNWVQSKQFLTFVFGRFLQFLFLAIYPLANIHEFGLASDRHRWIIFYGTCLGVKQDMSYEVDGHIGYVRSGAAEAPGHGI